MLTKTAERYFEGRAGIVRALEGSRSVSAVYQWGDVVPLAAARRLATLADGKLEVVESMYDELGRIARKPARTVRQSA